MHRSRKNQAFTLAETILCLALSTLLFGWLPHAAHLCGLALFSAIDAHAAQERVDQAVAILLPLTELCGYGLPKEPDEFRDSFEIPGYGPFNWAGPFSVTDGTSGHLEASNCRIVYAIPSGVRTTQETRTTARTFQVRTNTAPSNLESMGYTPRSTKYWALFAAATPRFRPAWLTTAPLADGGGVLLSLRRRGEEGEEMRIPRNDELFYLRAAEIQTRAYDTGINRDDFALCTDDQTGSGWQPRVIGIVDARFEADAGGRLLRVTLLVRGERRYDRAVTTGTPSGWPEKWAGDIPESARRYRLYTHSVAFDLKNF